jgi:hypothetical protein
MPLLLMTVRLEIHVVFHLSYSNFFNNIGPSGNRQIVSNGHPDNPAMPLHVTKAQHLMNGVITEILDPNMFFSRLSFLESGADAIDLKNELLQGKRVGFAGHKLPRISDKYYTRSSMIKNFFGTGTSTEGRIRAKFSDNLDSFRASLKDKTARYGRKRRAEEQTLSQIQ